MWSPVKENSSIEKWGSSRFLIFIAALWTVLVSESGHNGHCFQSSKDAKYGAEKQFPKRPFSGGNRYDLPSAWRANRTQNADRHHSASDPHWQARSLPLQTSDMFPPSESSIVAVSSEIFLPEGGSYSAALKLYTGMIRSIISAVGPIWEIISSIPL